MVEHLKHEYFHVYGRTALRGQITPQGNKNEAMPVIAACCLSSEPITLHNIPQIEDVSNMGIILEQLGAKIDRQGDTWKVHASNLNASRLPQELSSKLRGSVTLAGPLLSRCGQVFLPKPGGDKIGRRRLDTHILALQALGAKVSIEKDGFELWADELTGADILLDEMSVTATENAVCAAVLAKGRTTLRNAASEPHVQGLCNLLVKMGAQIQGIGSNVLTIEGVEKLKGTEHTVGPDYLEVGSFISLAAVTGGELLIKNAGVDNLRMIQLIFARLGIETQFQGNDVFVPAQQSLGIVNDLGGAVAHIEDAPWPAFPADMTSVALVTATQCRGTILIHEKMFESRLYFTDHLISMGARIVLCDPHRAVVIGPDRLRGATLTSPDIRAGMAMLIAALCADGESKIYNIVQIDRGFTQIEQRLKSLGAQIDRVVN